MNLLSLPAEVLEMVLCALNEPEMPITHWHRLPASTTGICDVDKIIAQDHDDVYPIWREWKRDLLALGSVCKGLRRSIFVRFWLENILLDWSEKELRRMGSMISEATRAKVQTLTLQTNCHDTNFKPRLVDYVKFFPNLREIKIALIAGDRPGSARFRTSKDTIGPYGELSTHQPSRKSSPNTSVERSSLQSINLTIGGSRESSTERGHESEVNAWVQKFRSSDQLRQVGITKLDHFHLELALGSDKFKEHHWNDFLPRLSLACSIPARKVSICFKFTFRGEVERFLKVLFLAIANWPSEIEGVSFCLSLEDYAPGNYQDILDMVVINNDGSVDLSMNGCLPSKTEMDRFIHEIRDHRPRLQQFNLTMYVAHPESPIQPKLFEYKYTATVGASLDDGTTGTLRIKVDQAALDDLDQLPAHIDDADSEEGFEDSEGPEEEEEAGDSFETIMMCWKLMTMIKSMSAAAHLGFDEFDDDLDSWEEDELEYYQETVYLEMMFIKCVESVMMAVREHDFDSDSNSDTDEDGSSSS